MSQDGAPAFNDTGVLAGCALPHLYGLTAEKFIGTVGEQAPLAIDH